MGFGIEIFDPSGRLIMDGTNRYARIIEILNLAALGVPGSRNYPDVDPASLCFQFSQGGGRAITVQQSGTTISWAYSDGYTWASFTGQPTITVVLQ